MKTLRLALVLGLIFALCASAFADDLTFEGKGGAKKFAEYLNSFLGRKVNDSKDPFWQVKAKGDLILVQRLTGGKKPGRILTLTSMGKAAGPYLLGPGGEITFILAPGCHVGFRCRITVPGESITSFGAGYGPKDKRLEKAAFYIAAGPEITPSKDLLPVKEDDKNLIASHVAMRIARKEGKAIFSYDLKNDGNFTALHTIEIGDSFAFFGMDDFENPGDPVPYLFQKITIKGVTK